ncbi:molybdopterin molybdotransferase MoeA [Pseudoalteromonas sp. MMG010]|uniref:molybdopterin molybdotransferase MoeA n=1 Tax=Pseudoalteromonas sp. MMG010 TaxID=2822685 RepID=UPI001B3A303F|nr:gephyrin-like molybdotransferase Glp [Pseudoalteromonas sp. MMG010]MBQ4832264.1 molybdopterin molybdotransferase MoeA [Pseudoalteromonas sp. MMG010]
MNDVCNAPGLLPVEQAISNILNSISATTLQETLDIHDCLERILSTDIVSTLNVPAYNNSAMDGYALCIQPDNLVYKQVGAVFAGDTYSDKLSPGQCVRIMTGAALPQGANAVVMQENTSVDNDNITITAQPKINENVRFAGEDIALNQVVLAKGCKLKTTDIGLLASLGIATVSVFKKVKVAVFSTGNELTYPGETLKPGAIFESNRAVLITSLKSLGAEVIDLGIIPDDKALITEAFNTADTQADAVISSGGVSVGEADFTKEVLEQIGRINFWKIAMKPGKPFAFGKLPNSYFFGLPGNPVSATITFKQLVVPALEKLAAQTQIAKKMRFSAKATTRIKKRPGRTDFQRAIAEVSESGELLVTPLAKQGSGVLSSISQANCLIILPAQSASLDANSMVNIEFL